MKNVLVAVAVCLVSVINAAAQWTPTGSTDSISHNGTVTIGTSTITSGYTLDVAGASRLGGNVFLGTGTLGTFNLYLWPDSSGPRIRGTGTGIDFVAQGGTIHLFNGNTIIEGWDPNPPTNTALTVKGTTASSANGALKVTDASNNSLMFVRNDGNIGIGTSNPGSLLHLKGPTGGGAAISFTSPGNQLLRVQTIPNVANWGGLSLNTSYTGAGWALDDTNQDGWFLKLDGRGQGSTYPATFFNGLWLYRVPLGLVNNQNLHTDDEYPTFGATNGYTYVREKLGIGTTLNVTPDSALQVVGSAHISVNLTVDGSISSKYQDLAEWVPAAEAMPNGTVVVVSSTTRNTVAPSQHAYDTSVAGVVSAEPGLILGVPSSTKAKIATTGRVRVRVDATSHPIAMGDLLVTSDKAGVAMRSEPLDLGGVKIHRPGTLVGKALEPLPSGQGEILVLLSLQ